MTFIDQLTTAFALMIPHSGTILVSSIGLVFAIVRRQRLGRVSTWAVWGFSLFLGYVLLRVATSTVTISLRIDSGLSPTDETFIVWAGVFNVMTGLLYLAAFVVLARSIFLDRGYIGGNV